MKNRKKSFRYIYKNSSATIFLSPAQEMISNLKDESISLLITSPPYFIGKEYDVSTSADDFIEAQKALLPQILRTVRTGGSICWQVGYHVVKNEIVPLDTLIYNATRSYPEFKLRNRLIWTFGHGVHAGRRFSGRHEVIMWFTKGDDYYFDLDSVRVPQKYPGKRHYKGPSKGELSGNPLGKNPADVWDIPNVKAGHVEKTAHPCQFPIALTRRLIRALSKPGETVLDPYMGSGTTAIGSLLEGRNFVGSETNLGYIEIARERIKALKSGALKHREDVPVYVPDGTEKVSQKPAHFKVHLPWE